MKNRSWSDEFEELILQYSGSCKDPPEEPEERKLEERKSRIKKLIREELNKNPVLSLGEILNKVMNTGEKLMIS